MESQPSLDVARLGSALDRLTRLLRRSSLPGDLSPAAASTLYTLVTTGPARLTALAAAEHVSQPAMTQLVARLEAAGLVARGADPDDGRVVIVSATDAGRDLSLARRAARGEVLATLLGRLPRDQRDAIAAAVPALEGLVALGDADPGRA
ncbi:MarR family winged helix-turn-helix transcriptional regulator [Actinotalea caeni]|uniref:MarR family winged helix-turn-helix transcriptional regulator n=1 Tax=Actinotalea caeni TaxID=1348467 RepID=UPI0012E30587|nr:MarR family transcriptional regulator [Actinotalea caeni]